MLSWMIALYLKCLAPHVFNAPLASNVNSAFATGGAYAPVALERSCRPAGLVVVAARPGRLPATGNVRARSLCVSASPFVHSVVSHPHPGKPALALEALPGENSRQTNFATPSS